MQEIFATRARTADGWQNNVSVRVLDGTIADVTPDTTPATGSVRVDTLLPALSNLHSHSFQRAMAGMTEVRAPGKDSFWTWRSLMYRFLDHLTPEHYQAIAALVFMEMQEAGYAAVAEFHYVHHQPGGVPYSDIAELSRRVLAAAGETGIGLTHLPVLYSYGGAGRQALSGGQLRFANSVERYGDLVSALRKSDLPADTR
ncbi:MAG: amidohydrolase family protein, partial [Rhodobacter sp.]|nr:amidohydrolase family protein [Rhodobacter sp.]